MIELAPLLLFAAVAAQPEDPAASERRNTVREVLEQLIAEDDNVWHSSDYRQHDHVSIGTHPRASLEGGMCERDVLRIERAPAVRPRPEGSSTIRKVEAEPWFFVLADESGQPLWRITGDELERRCAATNPSDARWFPAEDAAAARSAVSGAMALREELLRPSSEMVEWNCRPWRCPGRAGLAARIDPLDPGMVHRGSLQECPSNRWCVDVMLEDPVCGSWSTQLRMDRSDIGRFRSARIGNYLGSLHCGEQEMFEPQS